MKIYYLPAWATGLLVAGALLSSCEKELEPTEPTHPLPIITQDSIGVVKQGTFRGNPITYREINGQAILEGDILLSAEDLAPIKSEEGGPNSRIAGAGRNNKDYRWQNWTIPYVIGPNLNNEAINDAIQHWEDSTPLEFVPRTNETDYIQFTKSDEGNNSKVGRQGGMQIINLKKINSRTIIIHEIGHAVGLFHEHSRRDRDDYINIQWDNIWENKRDQYNRWRLGQGFDYGPFDYSSVMMYGPNHNSQNGQATITRKDGLNYTKGQSLSPIDIRTVIALYSNLYIVWNGELFAVSPKDGTSASLGKGWSGAAKILAEDDQYIWGMQGRSLWKTNRWNGAFEKVGNGYWENPIGVTGKDPQGNMYAQQGIYLWKIDKYGNHARLGGPQALENWSGTQAVYYHKNYLYVVWKNILYQINTTTGKPEKMFMNQPWYDVRGIAAVHGSSDNLYVMRGNALFRVNTVTGDVAGGENFADVKAMTGVGGYLYIVSGSKLIKMDEFSNKQILSSGWSATESIGATRNPSLTD